MQWSLFHIFFNHTLLYEALKQWHYKQNHILINSAFFYLCVIYLFMKFLSEQHHCDS